MSSIFLGLGSNIEPRLDYITRAKQALFKRNIAIVQTSSLYETEPLTLNQGWYINQVIQLDTNLPPQTLLNILKQLEHDLGRKARSRWAKREIDLDILLYDQQIIDTVDLVIPHAGLTERKFVLVPLAEIAPAVIEPRTGKTIKQLLDQCHDSLQCYHINPTTSSRNRS